MSSLEVRIEDKMMMFKIASVSSVSAFSSSSLAVPINPRRDFSLTTSLNPYFASRNSNHISLLVSASGRDGAKTEKNKKKGNGVDFADDGDEGWEEEEEEDGGWDDGEEDEEGMTPFDKMRKWMRNKPSGFGDGKTYDLSLEDKLMEEIEQSRRAQLANINKLKNSDTGNSSSSTQAKPAVAQKQLTKEIMIPSTGVRVRVGNLPKKRNIRRDLQTAFKDFPGIINIIPAVTGSKKTRDPVCRGFAFLDFQTEATANRFIKAYSKQSLSFGKVEKQVTCHIMIPDAEGKYASDMSTALASQEKISGRFDRRQVINPITLNSPITPSLQVKLAETRVENSEANQLNLEEGTNYLSVDNSGIDLSSSTDVQKKKATVSKQKTKKKMPQKASKVNMPGSASRLKIKERNVLSDVFSKYGGKAAILAK